MRLTSRRVGGGLLLIWSIGTAAWVVTVLRAWTPLARWAFTGDQSPQWWTTAITGTAVIAAIWAGISGYLQLDEARKANATQLRTALRPVLYPISARLHRNDDEPEELWPVVRVRNAGPGICMEYQVDVWVDAPSETQSDKGDVEDLVRMLKTTPPHGSCVILRVLEPGAEWESFLSAEPDLPFRIPAVDEVCFLVRVSYLDLTGHPYRYPEISPGQRLEHEIPYAAPVWATVLSGLPNEGR